MKKTVIFIAALLLTAAALAACAPQVPNRGTINGGIYASSDAKLVFVAPLGWRYFSDEEISAFKEYYIDNIRSAGIYVSDDMIEKAYVFDMIALDTGTGACAAVIYNNLALFPDGTNFTEDSYLDTIRGATKKTGLQDYEFHDYIDETIGANTYRIMPYTNKSTGISHYLCVRRAGDYMLCILVLAPEGNGLDPIVANFSWIEEQTE